MLNLTFLPFMVVSLSSSCAALDRTCPWTTWYSRTLVRAWVSLASAAKVAGGIFWKAALVGAKIVYVPGINTLLIIIQIKEQLGLPSRYKNRTNRTTTDALKDTYDHTASIGPKVSFYLLFKRWNPYGMFESDNQNKMFCCVTNQQFGLCAK